MKDKNKISKEELDEFFSEVNKAKESNVESTTKTVRINKYIVKCPKCNKELENRTDPCPYCHYKGYIPMSEAQIKKTRKIMFIIILSIALILLIIRRVF